MVLSFYEIEPSQKIRKLENQDSDIEKSLQQLFEMNLEELLGVRFIASEYSTGKVHKGRIDTLGIDENNVPVIIEYKRSVNENVINQGLYYYDWLLDHKAEFEKLAMKVWQLKHDDISWNNPRVVCIASGFTKYDEHAVNQIDKNIELYEYQLYEKRFISLNLVNTPSVKKEKTSAKTAAKVKVTTADIKGLYGDLRAYLLSLGDDVQETELKHYVAYKKIRNFTCVEIQAKKLLLSINLNPDQIKLEEGFSSDFRNVGHFGTGDLRVEIKNSSDFQKAKQLIIQSYERTK
ncbi:DUF91 domain-containing protein [Listeria weihenstephanensis]|uniref:DUF91 domain-containing protein n=1 Tax=Listeria weihenstephanensis TaxID=1006155 RepID=A0A841Z717_9LIST|nr:DUF5655 domain-containing protein [Listeria weihenstephanensis]MBC1500156.1 DUF91 domain-containing protein [Listeria weihenstephanensis]